MMNAACKDNDIIDIVGLGDEQKIEEPRVVIQKDKCTKDVNADIDDHETVCLKYKDKRFGWIVVLSSIFINFINGGLERSTGVLYMIFDSRFGSSAAIMGNVFSMVTTIRLFGGPIVGMLQERLSCRALIITGAISSCVGCIISMYATDIRFMFFSYGLLRGVGSLFIYVPVVIILSYYFDKRLALATGLSTAGTGVGCVALPPLLSYFAEMYEFGGLFLNIGGLFLNIIPLAMILRPIALHKRILRNEEYLKSIKASEMPEQRTFFNESNDKSNSIAHSKVSGGCPPLIVVSPDRSLIDDGGDSVDSESGDDINGSKARSCISHNFMLSNIIIDSTSILSILKRHKEDEKESMNAENESNKEHAHDSKPLKSRNKKKQSKKLCHFYLLKNPVFLMYCVSLTFATMALHPVLVYLPSVFKIKVGVSESDAAILVSIMGAMDTFSRVVLFGFAFDLKCIRPYRRWLYDFVMLLFAGVNLYMPSITTYGECVLVSLVYGVIFAGLVGPKSVIVTDILSAELMPVSFGILLMFQGFGSMSGSPIFGAIKDASGDFNMSFYYIAAVAFLGWLIFLIGNIIFSKQKKRSG